MPLLRVLAGPEPSALTDITQNVNTEAKLHIVTPYFDGHLVVNIKGFPDPSGRVLDSEYFERDDRKGLTWSIQVQGRFLQYHSADDILFGNTFDRPLKLPWGSGAALRFMSYMDPTLQHDLSSPTKPWALSPLISTMPYFAHARLEPSTENNLPPFPSQTSIKDDLAHIHLTRSSNQLNTTTESPESRSRSPSPTLSDHELNLHTAAQRRAYFHDAAHRKQLVFGPHDLLTTDFAYGFLSFFPSLALILPPAAGGLSFDLVSYWDGQPVRFVCCERAKEGEAGKGRVFWCVQIEMADSEGVKEIETKEAKEEVTGEDRGGDVD